MKATSFRLPDETLDLLNRLRLPGESQAVLIHRALIALDGQPRPMSVEALAQRIDQLESRLLALESGSAGVVRHMPKPKRELIRDVKPPAGNASQPDTQPDTDAFSLAPSEPGEDDIKAFVVQRIRQMRDQGMTSAGIAAALNVEGIPTFSGRGSWQSGTIRLLWK